MMQYYPLVCGCSHACKVWIGKYKTACTFYTEDYLDECRATKCFIPIEIVLANLIRGGMA